MTEWNDTVIFLVELRRRLIRCILVIGIVFIIFASFSQQIYHLFCLPLLKNLPSGKALISIAIPSPLFIPLKSAFVLAMYVTVPYWLYEIWSFIAPALYQQERRLGWIIVWLSTGLFYLGTLFAYFIVMPTMFNLFMSYAPKAVEVKPDIANYFSFVMQLFLAFGFAFEFPVAILLLISSGITTVENLRRKRPYIIIAAFVVAMLMTPPDVFSQIMLAIPLWMLYEISLWLARFLLPKILKVNTEHEN